MSKIGEPECGFCGRKLLQVKQTTWDNGMPQSKYLWTCLEHGIMYPNFKKTQVIMLETFGARFDGI